GGGGIYVMMASEEAKGYGRRSRPFDSGCCPGRLFSPGNPLRIPKPTRRGAPPHRILLGPPALRFLSPGQPLHLPRTGRDPLGYPVSRIAAEWLPGGAASHETDLRVRPVYLRLLPGLATRTKDQSRLLHCHGRQSLPPPARPGP